MWDLIVSVPDHCLSFYFDSALTKMQISIEKIAQELLTFTLNTLCTIVLNAKSCLKFICLLKSHFGVQHHGTEGLHTSIYTDI